MQLPKAIVGIDPGQTGAAALISDDEGAIDYFDWPGDAVAAAAEFGQWVEDYNIEMAILESVNAMPKQGVSSTFKFGQNHGMWLGILAAFQVPHKLVRPREWQKGLFKKGDGNAPKTRSLTVARRLFPRADLRLKKHNGRADALLMAVYGKNRRE